MNRFVDFQETSNEYGELLEKLESLQQKCMKDISHQRYRISQISSNLKKYDKMVFDIFSFSYLFFVLCKFLLFDFNRFVSSNVTTSDEKDQVADLEKNIIKRKAQLYDIDQTLPQKNGTYLNVHVFFLLHSNSHVCCFYVFVLCVTLLSLKHTIQIVDN